MLSLLLQKKNFFSIFFFILLFSAVIIIENYAIILDVDFIISFILALGSFVINFYFLENNDFIKNNYLSAILLLIFYLVFFPLFFSNYFSLSFLLLSTVNLLFYRENENIKLYILLGILLTLANIFFYPTLIMSIYIALYFLFFKNNFPKLLHFLLGIGATVLIIIQSFYIFDLTDFIQNYFCDIEYNLIDNDPNYYNYIPFYMILLASFIKFFSINNQQSTVIQKEFNIYTLSVIGVIILQIVFAQFTQQLVMFLAIPFILVISRIYAKEKIKRNQLIILTSVLLAFIILKFKLLS